MNIESHSPFESYKLEWLQHEQACKNAIPNTVRKTQVTNQNKYVSCWALTCITTADTGFITKGHDLQKPNNICPTSHLTQYFISVL